MDLLNALRDIVGDGGVLTGEDLTTRAADWLGLSTCQAKAVIRPRSTAELSAVMQRCHAVRQPVIGTGGLTGLVHGTDAQGHEIQISFERMRSVISVDPVGRTMLVEAGTPLQVVHEAAAAHGLIYPVDLGSRGSCTIGGNISTNAGGNTVVRYGMTRDNVLGLEAVLADGTVISSLNTLLKNNAAYDLKQLFIGSEGTLGLVTRAVLKLYPQPLSEGTALVALDSFDAVMAFFAHCGRRLGGLLSSFEVMWQSHYELIAVNSGRHNPPLPGGHGYYAIVEATGTDAERDEALFAQVLGEALEQGHASDVVIAASKAQRAAIWGIREDIEGLFGALTPSCTFDVSMPIAAMDDYVLKLTAAAHAEWGADTRVVVFGHLGDGNLHILVAPRPWSAEAPHKVETLVYEPLRALGGSISAEHGIGLEKRAWLNVSRTPEEIALMHTLKAALDPLGLLNPGKVLR
ncbi:FAD-binding oxidoreductase [Novosphingobium arvoryzae]|uniref:Oxidoreductase n=1 Tax=Novosphingobium arvoryzae TaxID=1256514 RepID=A0A918VC68_9SPHN|nr:FAD-binding oxidoreductase [Novosphingobium arvoryzae]GGZ87565.1 oxidoreductase [Novosphingobium arvoryzae]